MGKASSSKKVARAASTGGGRTAGGRFAWGYYGTLAAIVAILGLVLVLSVADYRDSDAFADDSPPQNGDHWHAVFGIYACDEFLPEIQDERDPKGIHTHADGVIHIHPFVRSAMGKNATLGVFADAVRMDLSRTSFDVPGGDRYTNGDECNGKEAEVQIWVNGVRQQIDPNDLPLNDRDNVVLAFVPPGTEVPQVPGAENKLSNLTDMPPSTVPVPGADPTATVPAEGEPGAEAPDDGTTDTSAPAENTDSTATTTAAPAPSSAPTTAAP